MVKKAYRKMKKSVIFLHVVVAIILCLACTERGKDFRRVDEESFRSYEDPQNILWNNNEAILKPLIHNSPLPDIYDIYLLLEVKDGSDTLFYLLKNTDKGNFSVHGDSLYIFNKGIGSNFEAFGWCKYQDESIELIDSADVVDLFGNEKLTKYNDEIEKSGYGVYRLRDDRLYKIASSFKERKNFKENKNKSGIYYIDSPGLGVERIFNLNSIVAIIKQEHPLFIKPDYL